MDPDCGASESGWVTLAFAEVGGLRGTAGAAGGPVTGARGNLRDSDATKSRHDYPLYNWCVHFDEPVL